MKRILLIDDRADGCFATETVLQLAGYKVITAVSGSEGLRLAAVEKPDLIVLDVMMADLPGTLVLKLLKRHGATAAIPVVMNTGEGYAVSRGASMKAGAVAYVVKGDPDALLAAIASALKGGST